MPRAVQSGRCNRRRPRRRTPAKDRPRRPIGLHPAPSLAHLAPHSGARRARGEGRLRPSRGRPSTSASAVAAVRHRPAPLKRPLPGGFHPKPSPRRAELRRRARAEAVRHNSPRAAPEMRGKVSQGARAQVLHCFGRPDFRHNGGAEIVGGAPSTRRADLTRSCWCLGGIDAPHMHRAQCAALHLSDARLQSQCATNTPSTLGVEPESSIRERTRCNCCTRCKNALRACFENTDLPSNIEVPSQAPMSCHDATTAFNEMINKKTHEGPGRDLVENTHSGRASVVGAQCFFLLNLRRRKGECHSSVDPLSRPRYNLACKPSRFAFECALQGCPDASRTVAAVTPQELDAEADATSDEAEAGRHPFRQPNAQAPNEAIHGPPKQGLRSQTGAMHRHTSIERKAEHWTKTTGDATYPLRSSHA